MRRLIVLLALCIASLPAAAQKCQGLLEARAAASGAIQALYDALVKSDAACGSIKLIMSRVASRERTGGRKLEPDRPLDVPKAQANLDAALREPAVKARIDKARNDIADESARLAYEAVVFDEEGFYGARDLRLSQLQQRVN